MFDLLIAGGSVVDGTGTRPAFAADVGIEGKEIAAIGDLSGSDATRVIDAAGLVVAPGFIDTHAHSEGALLVDPQHENGLRQGITTEMLGPDGISYAPLDREGYRTFRSYKAGLFGWPPEDLDMSSIGAFRGNYHRRTAINVVACAPHGVIRIATVGYGDVALRGEALERARRLVRECIEQGARAFSTGLSYFPQAWADTEELVELSRVAAEYGVPYHVHIRTHKRERAFGGGGIPEAMEVGRRSGAAVHIEHYRTGPRNAGRVDELVADVDRAKAEGVDVTLEAYPYAHGAGTAHLLLPEWVLEAGPEGIAENLEDPAKRERIVREVEEFRASRETAGDVWTWMSTQKNKWLEGMNFEDAARARGTSVGEMVVQVVLEERLACGRMQAPLPSAAVTRQVEKDFMELLARDDYMIGSDAIPLDGMVHPRAWGTFPKAIGRLRRRHGYALEQVVQRATDNPARRFGLTKRGRVEAGYFADLVVFDAARMCDLATFEDPRTPPAGIPYVVVNGQVAVDSERCTGVLAGEAIP
ncbi:MAG: amidohydrolase family protein [Gemmatimonadetes bacterium]|nr:amidohydrolase family protein [Gemmatimonadota bacterium]